MKKTRRENVEVARMREERKRRKLMKRMKEIDAMPRMLKTIDECEPDESLMQNFEARRRPPLQLSADEEDRRARLFKDYQRFQRVQAEHQRTTLTARFRAQARALQQLKAVNPRLYDAAIQPDHNLIGMSHIGPRYTPPVKDNDPMDGDYDETTKKYIY